MNAMSPFHTAALDQFLPPPPASSFTSHWCRTKSWWQNWSGWIDGRCGESMEPMLETLTHKAHKRAWALFRLARADHHRLYLLWTGATQLVESQEAHLFSRPWSGDLNLFHKNKNTIPLCILCTKQMSEMIEVNWVVSKVSSTHFCILKSLSRFRDNLLSGSSYLGYIPISSRFLTLVNPFYFEISSLLLYFC